MMFVKYPLLPLDVMEQNKTPKNKQKKNSKQVCMLLIEQKVCMLLAEQTRRKRSINKNKGTHSTKSKQRRGKQKKKEGKAESSQNVIVCCC